MNKDIKSLEVFSKKIGKPIKIQTPNRLVLQPALASSWTDKGWNNYGPSWQDKGWNNYGPSWLDNGWNNYGPSWQDKGWNNYGSSWTDSGWSNGGSGCFITTACVENKGLSDDCEELTILRLFRDKLVEEDPKFRKQVLEYYKNAPIIVKKISEDSNKQQILDDLYDNLVVECVNMLKQNKIEEAKQHYTDVYKKLSLKYIPKVNK